MFLSRYISSVIVTVMTVLACGCSGRRNEAVNTYYIHPQLPGRSSDQKMADYMKKHLQKRSENVLLSNEGIEIAIHVADDFGGDYAIKSLPDGGKLLSAKDERVMTWLVYQCIKEMGMVDPGITVDDLPPANIPHKDTVYTFPFQYRDIYMPSNQNPDVTYLLGLNNLEMDWGIWGHNLSRVLGGNGSSSFGYQNMDQEMFARSNGIVYKNQFCFSSDKLYDLTVQYIIDQFGDGEKVPYNMTISPNDNDHVCMCRRCEMAGNKPGNATPALVGFVERLSARFPHHTFYIPGYSTSSALPDHELPENMGVFLSAIEYPRIWNGDDSKQGKAFFEKLESWKSYTDNIYIWDYINNFDDYLSPYPILSVMQQRLQNYRSYGVKGIFLNGSGYFYSALQEMYTYCLAALLVNPDADVKYLVQQYFRDAMPHVGEFFSTVILSMENHAKRSGTEFPLYGGMEEEVRSYLFEKEYREFYPVFLRARDMEMTHRERVIYEKTRQFVSFSFLEMCRMHGLGAGGFAELIGEQWVVKPEVWAAVEDLKAMTDEDDLYLLTGCENSTMDQMDRVNENGVYIADYENEVELWLAGQWWSNNYLIRQPVKVRYDGGSEVSTKLTDAVVGISQNYHWGWQVYPQKDLVIELPAAAVSGHSGEMFTAFLNSERHRMAPPKSIQVWADGRQVAILNREGLVDYFDEGEKVVFRGLASFGKVSQVELRFVPSHTRNLALDEIFFK